MQRLDALCSIILHFNIDGRVDPVAVQFSAVSTLGDSLSKPLLVKRIRAKPTFYEPLLRILPCMALESLEPSDWLKVVLRSM